MQTFLPGNSFQDSADWLDPKRRRNQVVEVFRILEALEHGGGWAHHPMTKAWRFHRWALACYGSSCVQGLTGPYWDSHNERFTAVMRSTSSEPWFPPWITPALRRSHRGHLYRKDPGQYPGFFMDEDSPLLYPVIRDDHPDFPGQLAFAFVARYGEGKQVRFGPADKKGNPIIGTPLYRQVADAARYAEWAVQGGMTCES